MFKTLDDAWFWCLILTLILTLYDSWCMNWNSITNGRTNGWTNERTTLTLESLRDWKLQIKIEFYWTDSGMKKNKHFEKKMRRIEEDWGESTFVFKFGLDFLDFFGLTIINFSICQLGAWNHQFTFESKRKKRQIN